VTQPQAQKQRRPPPPFVAPLIAPAVGPVIYGALGLRQAQDVGLRPLLKRVRQLFRVQGVPVTAEQRDAIVPYLWRPLNNARSRTYTASVRYLHGQGVLDTPPLRPYEPQALDKLLTDTVERTTVVGDPITEENRTSPLVVEQAQKAVARAVSRHAQEPARETVQQVADDAGEEVGWARMLTGPRSCGFCAMLASRGPVYRSDKSALFRGGASADAYHDGCDCVAVLVRKGIPWEGQESHEVLDKLWQATGGKFSGKDARNAFRREWDRTVRSGGSGDFVADTMKPPGGA
jgi:hypothetical protein